MFYSFSGGVFLRMEYFLDSFLLASVAGIWFDWCSVLFCIKYCLSKAWCSLLDSFYTHQSWDFRKLQIAFLTERMFWKEQVSRISESLDLAGFQHHRAPNLFLVAATFPWEWSTSEKRAVFFPPNLVVLLYKILPILTSFEVMAKSKQRNLSAQRR